MKKLFCLLAAGLLLSSVAWAEEARVTNQEKPRIIDPEININLETRTLEISFQYADVAGHIDVAEKTILLGVVTASGGLTLNVISLKVAEPRTGKGDGITPNIVTQGKGNYSARL